MFEPGETVWVEGPEGGYWGRLIESTVLQSELGELLEGYRVRSDETGFVESYEEDDVYTEGDYRQRYWYDIAEKERLFQLGDKVVLIGKGDNLFFRHARMLIQRLIGKVVTIDGVAPNYDDDYPWGYTFQELDYYIVCPPFMFSSLKMQKEKGFAQPGLPNV